MKKWELMASANVPDDDQEMLLMKRGSEWAVYVEYRQLMTSKEHASEDALADWACDRLSDELLTDARILVGGMGMGFTLAAALRRVGPEGRVTVAELIAEVVDWNRDYKAGKASGYPLKDPRALVHIGDVGELLFNPKELWSAVLLDVDNGPNHLTRPSNGWLYTREGLDRAWNSLIPGGILGVWSADDDDDFTARLRDRGFETEILFCTEEGRPTPDWSGTQVVWMARKPA